MASSGPVILRIKGCIVDASLFDMYVCIFSIDIGRVDRWFYVTVSAVSRHLPGPPPLGEGKIERAGRWSLKGLALSLLGICVRHLLGLVAGSPVSFLMGLVHHQRALPSWRGQFVDGTPTPSSGDAHARRQSERYFLDSVSCGRMRRPVRLGAISVPFVGHKAAWLEKIGTPLQKHVVIAI